MRKPKLMVHAFDVSSTLLGPVPELDSLNLRGFMCGALAKALAGSGLADKECFGAMEEFARKYREGYLDYAAAADGLLQAFASGLKGRDAAEVKHAAEDFSRDYCNRAAYDFSRPLLRLLKQGRPGVPGFVVLVSGDIDFTMPQVVEFLGADCSEASALEQRAGRLTGRVLASMVKPGEKSKALAAKIEELGRQFEVFGGVGGGDSPDDVAMALDNGLAPVAFGENLKQAAAQNNWVRVNPATQPAQKVITEILSAIRA